MTNVSATPVPVKSDEPAPHGRNNTAETSNHERINYQWKTGNKMINDDNQRDLNIQLYETSRCCNQSEMTVTTVYQRSDSVSNQLPHCLWFIQHNQNNLLLTFLRTLLCKTNLPVFVPNYIA